MLSGLLSPHTPQSLQTASPPPSQDRPCAPLHLIPVTFHEGLKVTQPFLLACSASLSAGSFLLICKHAPSLPFPEPFLDCAFSSAAALPPLFHHRGHSRGQAAPTASSFNTHPVTPPGCPPHSSQHPPDQITPVEALLASGGCWDKDWNTDVAA